MTREPKRIVVVRMDPAVYEQMTALGGGNVSRTVEEAVRAWIRRQRRKEAPEPSTDRRTVAGRKGED
jgi:hypothetical protein